MSAVDELIKQWVKRAEQSGELKNNPLHGKPLNMNDGYLDTPEEVRMTYKILKNAGYVPAEVQALKDLAALREALNDCTDEQEARAAGEDRQHPTEGRHDAGAPEHESLRPFRGQALR